MATDTAELVATRYPAPDPRRHAWQVPTFLVGAALGAYGSASARPATPSSSAAPVVTEASVAPATPSAPEQSVVGPADTGQVTKTTDSKSTQPRPTPSVVRVSDAHPTPRKPARLTPARSTCSQKAE